jgi:hypothetical protein
MKLLRIILRSRSAAQDSDGIPEIGPDYSEKGKRQADVIVRGRRPRNISEGAVGFRVTSAGHLLPNAVPSEGSRKTRVYKDLGRIYLGV